ncbi:MAG TPA: NHL repeat-containing protein [Planctomycetaceae bacterium]|jgi:sugar lactone lactonase YvrE|nr:NHL repeat-containing protein [Planctomycetaceae bacterium]
MGLRVGGAASLILCFGASIGLAAEEFHYPLKPAVAANGSVYVADLKLPGIVVVQKGVIEKFFTATKKIGSPLSRVRCVAIDRNGKVLAGDTATREVYRFDEPGKPTPLTKGAQAGIGIPMAIAVDSKGNIFVADLEVQAIWKIPPAGGAAEKFADVPAPCGMAIDDKDVLWVVSRSKRQLFRVSPDRKVEAVVGNRQFQFPNDIALDGHGTVYISDGYAKTIWKLANGAKPESWIADKQLVNPVGLAWHDGSLVIADPNPQAKTGQVYKADAAGKLSPLVGK